MLGLTYGSLVEVGPKLDIRSGLAASWGFNKDSTELRLKLRKNVKFHSGRDFTAKDVKYTMEQLAAPDTKAGLGAGYVANIVGVAEVKAGTTKELSGIKIIDDHTIEVRFTKPDVLFPIYPIWFMDSGIVTEKGVDWVRTVSAGTGPYNHLQ
jgi:ABC-type transport system substrate-binding protein